MSEIRISTITKVGKLSENFDLQDLFTKFEVDDKVTYIEYGDLKPKGKNNKKKKAKKQTGNRKNYFYNQLSILVQCEKIVNVKIFNNGSIQMTGIKTDRMAHEVVDILLTKISDICNITVRVINLRTVLINSDFDYGYSINNNNLQELLDSGKYYSTYEPCSYPGVNIKYYYNENFKNNFGICQCLDMCDGKGNDGCCKRVTIAVFKSGKIIITGGRAIEHIYVAKDFIKDFIYRNKENILLDYLDYVIKIQRNYRNYIKYRKKKL
tara:strand:+ start:2872 stop:3669 length:798 start_codon:yes stop_codon:yes gene_type:complete